MSCNCSWSTVLNPLNLVRAMWDFAVYCWRGFRIFWLRLTRSERAPTVENIATFQNQPTEGRHMRRDFSLQAHQGSVSSSMQESTLSERSPGIEAFRISETPSQTSRLSSDGEHSEPGSARIPRAVKTDHDALLHGKRRPRSLERPVFTFEGTQSRVVASSAPASERSYKTFESRTSD